jgi:transposase
VRVVVNYEAGQDGFWILRALSSRGIDCYMVDAASIPVERHKRRAKTDRLDAIRLVINLRAWLHGECDRMRVVRAPSAQDEALRHLIRDRGQLHKEVLQHRERMRKLLVTLGCWDEVDHRSFPRRLAAGQLSCHDGTPLPDELRERLLRETARLELAEQQLAALERTLQERLPTPVRERITYPQAPQGRWSYRRVAPHARTILAPVPQPSPARCMYGPGAAAVRHVTAFDDFSNRHLTFSGVRFERQGVGPGDISG